MSAETSSRLFAFAVEAAREGTASVVAWAPACNPDQIIDWFQVDPGEEARDDCHAANLSGLYGADVVFLGSLSLEKLETVSLIGDK
ncbi:MAG: hypothetical protein QG553_464 [Patescibacteria group bacterium]|nr:hypothetical protein [Patescibacteria group bacterium]